MSGTSWRWGRSRIWRPRVAARGRRSPADDDTGDIGDTTHQGTGHRYPKPVLRKRGTRKFWRWGVGWSETGRADPPAGAKSLEY
jgi:hypothetical protein